MPLSCKPLNLARTWHSDSLPAASGARTNWEALGLLLLPPPPPPLLLLWENRMSLHEGETGVRHSPASYFELRSHPGNRVHWERLIVSRDIFKSPLAALKLSRDITDINCCFLKDVAFCSFLYLAPDHQGSLKYSKYFKGSDIFVPCYSLLLLAPSDHHLEWQTYFRMVQKRRHFII